MIKLLGVPVKEQILSEVDTKNIDKPLTIVVSTELSNASRTYVHNKVKACSKLGINSKIAELPPNIHELRKFLKEHTTCNNSPIIVQMPFGNIKLNEFSEYILAHEDVDGINVRNIGRLVLEEDGIIPATANGIMKLLDYYNLGNIEGKNAVIIGRSHIVGLPLFQLMLQRNATVTVCHSKTANLKQYTKNADIIVVAVGKPNTLTADMIGDNKPIIIDVGINRVDGKLCGDVDFDNVAPLSSAITPVPGGVGQLTVACVIQNFIKCVNM